MAYYKRIYYVDYYENSTKHTNAGFIKLAQWKRNEESESESRTCFQIYVSALLLKEETECEVKVIYGSREIQVGNVYIIAGKGMARIKCLESILYEIDREENQEQVLLRVASGKGHYFECTLREAACVQEQKINLEAAEVEILPSEKPVVSISNVQAENTPENEGLDVSTAGRHVKRDKWQQLCEMYPHIRPFEDEREYLRLELPDMIVLSDLYYRLVENSFLLHGYYNYGHLILTKMYKKRREKLYIGVPGNYYEREKQVAVMFGFESFEPVAEPAAEGDFGYYMIGVDI